jgi:hypothetical protein
MRSRGEIEQVLQDAMVLSAGKQRKLLVKQLSFDELLLAADIMDKLQVSYGHYEHRAENESQCQVCGPIETDNDLVRWAFHPGSLALTIAVRY